MQKSVLSLSTYAKSNKRVIQTNNLYILSSCDYHQRHYSHLLRANAQDDGNGKFFPFSPFIPMCIKLNRIAHMGTGIKTRM